MNSRFMNNSGESLDLIVFYISFFKKVLGYLDSFFGALYEFSSVLWSKHPLSQAVEVGIEYFKETVFFFLIDISEVLSNAGT